MARNTRARLRNPLIAPPGAGVAVPFLVRIDAITPCGRMPALDCSKRTDRTAATHSSATGSTIQAYQGNRTVGTGGGLASVTVGVLLLPFPLPLLPLPVVGDETEGADGFDALTERCIPCGVFQSGGNGTG